MSKQGKQLRSVLYHPKKVAGTMLVHPLNLNTNELRMERRNENKRRKISRKIHRKRKQHGRS